MAKTVMDQLVKYGEVKRGMLGVQVVTLTPDYAENLGIKDTQGALVSQVVEGSAADKAGLKAGDVITSINGQPVKSSRTCATGSAFCAWARRSTSPTCAKPRRARQPLSCRLAPKATRVAAVAICIAASMVRNWPTPRAVQESR